MWGAFFIYSPYLKHCIVAMNYYKKQVKCFMSLLLLPPAVILGLHPPLPSLLREARESRYKLKQGLNFAEFTRIFLDSHNFRL